MSKKLCLMLVIVGLLVSMTGFAWAQEPITFTYWTDLPLNASKAMKSLGESVVYQEVEKRLGIKLEFIHPAQGQANEQFNLMIASGELPDMIQGADRYIGGGEKAVQNGIYLKLNDLIPQYAPNYDRLRKSTPGRARETVSDDGTIWGITAIMNVENPTWYGPVIKKEMLEATGLSEPVTLEDWYKVLKAIKGKFGTESPLVFDHPNFANTGTDQFAVFLSAYGVGPAFYKEGDTIKFGPTQPAFKDYLVMMQKWYAEGLIDMDFPVSTTQIARGKFASDKAAAMAISIDTANNILKAQKIDYVAPPFPVLKPGDHLGYRGKDWDTTPGWTTAITTACKHPEEALRFLDYAFSDEGHMLYNYGVEGQSWTMEDGKPVFTDYMMKNPEYPTEVAVWKLKMHAAPQLRYGAYSNPSTMVNPQVLQIKERWTEQVGFDMMIPPTSLTSDEGKKFANIMTEINAYKNEMVLKFIMGKESLDNFDKYVTQLEKMNIAEAVALQQAAYDRFLKR